MKPAVTVESVDGGSLGSAPTPSGGLSTGKHTKFLTVRIEDGGIVTQNSGGIKSVIPSLLPDIKRSSAGHAT